MELPSNENTGIALSFKTGAPNLTLACFKCLRERSLNWGISHEKIASLIFNSGPDGKPCKPIKDKQIQKGITQVNGFSAARFL